MQQPIHWCSGIYHAYVKNLKAQRSYGLRASSLEIVAEYSHKGGKSFLEKHRQSELEEIREIISLVDASACKTKESEEQTMMGKMLYSPKAMNKKFFELFEERGWETNLRIDVKTTIPEIGGTHEGTREMDMVKNKVGVEVQFGKYAFMVYNVSAKMTIFANQGLIDSGVEIVAMREMTKEMSTGVSYFEQMKTDLEYRGEADIDLPVLVIGIDVEGRPRQSQLIQRIRKVS